MSNHKHTSEYHREWRKNNPTKNRIAVEKYRLTEKGQLSVRRAHLKKYSLTIEMYDQMFEEQNGKCPICLEKLNPPCIDHDHGTGVVRGLLCRGCNVGIGNLRDDIARTYRAVAYLQRSKRSELIHPLALIGSAPEHREFYSDPDAVAYPVEIHPTARVNAFVTVDAGYEGPTRIGANVLLMTKTHIGHDAQIGDGVEIAPMSSVGGYVVIGNNVKVGQGALFKPYVVVGDNAVIGMGAVVTKNVPAGETWIGNPARSMERKETDNDLWANQYGRA